VSKTLKILVVRFSSIGDIVLTTPVVRALKKQLNAEVHFLTKSPFTSFLINNPYVDVVYQIDKSVNEVNSDLKNEKYDLVVDLHSNLRSKKLRNIGKKYVKYNKDTFKKFLFVKFSVDRLKSKHTVERYFDTVEKMDVKNDNEGLDFFFSKKDEIDLTVFPKPYITFAIGGMHFTKKLPTEKIISICKKRKDSVVLIGGPEDFEIGKIIESNCDNVINTCGKYNINESAFIVNNSDLLITHDTGMMHIAAALGKKTFSIFGGTHPNLGFTPYMPNSENRIIQIENLDCRPCHRYGKNKCPKGHFKCMQEIDENNFLSK
jgi:heptosyltransferase-2